MSVLWTIAKFIAVAMVLGGLWVAWLLWKYGPLDDHEEGDK